MRSSCLDVLRGVLSWIVVLVHVLWFSGFHGPVSLAGAWAVGVFVVLSGYVITGLLWTRKPSYASFITTRLCRLYPAFLFCLLLSLAIRPLVYGTGEHLDSLREASENAFYWQHLIAHLSMLYGMIPTEVMPQAQFAFLVPAWSVSLEFQLYLIAPLVLMAVSRYGLRALYIALGIAFLFVLPPVYWRMGEVWNSVGAFFPMKAFWFLCGMLCWFRFGPLRDPFRWPSITVWIGEISYSTYLIHWPILSLINAKLPRVFQGWDRALLLATVGVPATLFASALLHRYIETPGIAFGRRLTGRARERRLTPDTPDCDRPGYAGALNNS